MRCLRVPQTACGQRRARFLNLGWKAEPRVMVSQGIGAPKFPATTEIWRRGVRSERARRVTQRSEGYVALTRRNLPMLR
jgi:hypothetical protein